MRTAIPTLVATGALAIAGWHAPLRAQGALGGVGGLGELIGSFVTRQAYVGSTRVTLLQLRDPTPRLALHGFSIATPAAAGWYLAYPEPSRADVVQAVWFVKDPHRFTAWAKGNRIPARPLSLMATLRFYGNTSAGGFPARLKELKTAEWTAGGVRVLALETRPMRLSNVECAEYEATLVDRRAPFGFDEQPFLVTVSGRACPHPDAPWLTVDLAHASRTPEGQPAPPADPAGQTFVQSLMLDPLRGPIVEDILMLDRVERPRPRDNPFSIDGAIAGGGALWVSHRVAGQLPGILLSRIDMTSNTVVAQIPVQGPVTGIMSDRVWVATKDRAWRIDPAASTAMEEIRLTCAPREFWSSYSSSFVAGEFGVWLACSSPAQGKKHPSFNLPGFLKRLDVETGRPVAEIELPRPLEMVIGDARRIWARDVDRTTCRLHEIDPATNRLVRTLVVGRFECNDLAVAGDEAWMTRKVRTEIIKVDLIAGRIMGAVTLAGGRLATDLAVTGDAVWVSTAPEFDLFGAPPGSLGVLLRIDRSRAQASRTMIPTATADRLIGVQGETVWLYDRAGAIIKVREQRPMATRCGPAAATASPRKNYSGREAGTPCGYCSVGNNIRPSTVAKNVTQPPPGARRP
jgi:hypothetical protein